MDEIGIRVERSPWNKGKLVGQKAPFKLKEIWAIRVRLQIFRRTRELALFDLGIDSKLRVRPAQAEGSRRLSRRARRGTGDSVATKDIETCAVRDHRADPNRTGRLD
jgi:hypothetical protein